MSDFKAKMHENRPISIGAPPQTPLGELTALRQTPLLNLRGTTSKGRGGQTREGMVPSTFFLGSTPMHRMGVNFRLMHKSAQRIHKGSSRS